MEKSKHYSFSQLYIQGSARSQFWIFAVRGVGAVNSLFVLKILSVYQFGLYQLVLAALALAESFTVGLLDEIASVEISRALAERRPEIAKRLFKELFFMKFLFGVVGGLALFFGADVVARFYGSNIGEFVRLASILFFLGTLRSVEDLFFSATRSFSGFAAPGVQEIIRLGGLGLVWFSGVRGLREILLVLIISSVGAFFYVSALFIREYRGVFSGVLESRAHLLFGLSRRYGNLVFLRYAVSRFRSADIWLVRFFLTTEAVGLYAAALNLFTIVQGFFPLGMISRLLPWEIHDKERFAQIYRRGIKYIVWGAIPMAAAMFFAVPWLAALALPNYLPAANLFRWLALLLPLYAIYKFQKSILTVLREQKILTMRLVTEAFIAVLILVLLLPLIGLYAVLVMYLFVYGWRVPLYAFYLKKRYPHLTLRLVHLFSFDDLDRLFFARVRQELFRFRTWAGSTRAEP